MTDTPPRTSGGVRRATVVDLPALLSIARECYPAFEETKASDWSLSALMSPNIACFRDDDAFACAGLSEFFWEDQKRANLIFLGARKGAVWQTVRVMRAVLGWAKSRGAGSFHFGEETGMDMAPIARRIRAMKDRPSYRIDLRSAQHRFWMRAA